METSRCCVWAWTVDSDEVAQAASVLAAIERVNCSPMRDEMIYLCLGAGRGAVLVDRTGALGAPGSSAVTLSAAARGHRASRGVLPDGPLFLWSILVELCRVVELR